MWRIWGKKSGGEREGTDEVSIMAGVGGSGAEVCEEGVAAGERGEGIWEIVFGEGAKVGSHIYERVRARRGILY